VSRRIYADSAISVEKRPRQRYIKANIDEEMMSLRLVLLIPLALSACTSKDGTPPPDTARAASASSARRVAEAYVDAWNRHDSAAIDTLIALRGTHEDMPSGFVATGPAGVHGMMRDLSQSLPDYAWNITEVVEGSPNLALVWTWKGTFTGKDPTGKDVKNVPVSGVGSSIVEVENGRIKRMRNYYDEASLFRRPKT
jgi:predicted ester cyclase